MKKLCLLFLIIYNQSFAQTIDNLYELNFMDDLLTEEVQDIISENIENKRVVFLGESAHHIGSDFLAKAEFVKYLVNEKGSIVYFQFGKRSTPNRRKFNLDFNKNTE